MELRAMRAAVGCRARFFRCLSTMAYTVIAALLLTAGVWVFDEILLAPLGIR